MKQENWPFSQDLVLIGGGHTHALVLRKWAMNPLAGCRLTLINAGPSAAYSGMLPGFVAGHYDRDSLDIDLVRLATAARARMISSPAIGLDVERKRITFDDRPALSFDVASIDIGITSQMPEIPGFETHAIAAKPLHIFATRWEAFRDQPGAARIVVIGGGVAGAELAMAMAHALQQKRRPAQVTLVDRNEALTGVRPRSAHLLLKTLRRWGVSVLNHAQVMKIEADGVTLQDGQRIESDFTVGAARACPYGWIAQSGLAVQDGYIKVDQYLRSSDHAIFAAGDCAEMQHEPRPKAGVFAVRQAPALYQNLRATVAGNTRLHAYHPQRSYLKLVSLGGKAALADKSGIRLTGRAIWHWKDRIDRAFMAKFQDLPRMPAPSLPKDHAKGLGDALGDKPACGGCGSKLGTSVLRGGLSPAGLGALRDDSAVLDTGGATQVMSTDHLRALVEDPVQMARITAVHALGDIWAMGAQPQAATVSIILPRMSPKLAERSLSEIMQAAQQTLDAAGAEVVGGHSSMGAELTIGFTLTGLCNRPPISLDGAKPGDVLLLTKPLGTGVVMAAAMQGQAKGIWVEAALASMQRLQRSESESLRDAHAMTDVTGFGLAGHLDNICAASGLGAEINLAALPLLPGARDLAQQGIRSTLFPENRAALPGWPQDPMTDLLFDPQTAGGLLAAVPRHKAMEIQTKCGPHAVQIGQMTEAGDQIRLV